MLHDIATIGTLALLEGILSADNALVLAVLVRHLPPEERKRALKYGIIGAFAFRFLCVLVTAWLIHAWYFKALGALYLLYIGLEHVFWHKDKREGEREVAGLGFWPTVIKVELTDLAFSIDSILAAVALSPKLWVVYLGGVLGLVAMRFVAGGFLKLIDRFPGLEMGAYLLVAWIGLKLGLLTCQEEIANFPHLMTPTLFWGMMALLFFGSMFLPQNKTK